MQLIARFKNWCTGVPAWVKQWLRGLPALGKERFFELFTALMGFHIFSLLWFIFLALATLMLAVRGIFHAGIFQLVSLEESPSLLFLHDHYGSVYWTTVGVGVLLLGCCIGALRKSVRTDRLSQILLAGTGLILGLSAMASRYQGEKASLVVHDVGLLDWSFVVCMPVVAISFMKLMGRRTQKLEGEEAKPAHRAERRLSRPVLVYLLSSLTIILYVIPIHQDYWYIIGQDGEFYTGFLKPGEEQDVWVVLYSCSAFFASLAAVCAVGAWGIYKWALKRSTRDGVALSVRDCLYIAGMLGFAWAVVGVVPWIAKVWPEIAAEDGEVFPAAVFTAACSGLIPLIYISMLMLKIDFDRAASRDGRKGLLTCEYAFIAFTVAPIYPWIRLFRPRNFVALGVGLLVLSAGGEIWFAYFVDNYTVDGFDFRDTIRKSQIPFMRVYLSLVIAWFAYILGQRATSASVWLWGRIRSRFSLSSSLDAMVSGVKRVTEAGVYVAALLCALTASLPLWYWEYADISKNTFVRSVEHSARHEFELIVIHAIFDFDRDGYSAILHGGDPDDFDSSVTGTGFTALEPVDLPLDEFEIIDPQKVEAFPNILILTLEGVTREAISVYGHRELEAGRVATPNIDAIASEGTVFTGGRAAYPSTWDAWLMINSGRFIRVTEMDNILSFEDRYSRHNNMNKVGKLAGVDRWCHSNAAAYDQMIVGPDPLKTNWEGGEDWEEISDEEADLGMYRGDKHILRVERFLDSLEPGEKFFISEHMADTHFPWYATERPQAELMGYPEGLDWADADGMQHDIDHLNYLQEVTRMDWQVGQMMEDLKERDLYDDTLIIIIGDHGCQWREHGHKYYPGHLYDPALKIPVIIKMPGIEGGHFVDVPVLQMDILTTVSDLAGIQHANPDVTGEMPGCSLVPFMEQRAQAEDFARCQERDMLLSTHYDMFGYIDDFRYKLIADRLTGTYFLFDLEEDPGEKNNLVDSHPELFLYMVEGLRQEVQRNPAFVAGVVR